MFAALDIGNSYIKIQLFSADKLINYYKFSHDEIGKISELILISNAAVSSVVPNLTKKVIEIFKEKNVLPFVISSEVKLNFKNLYKTPNTLGADRICNIAGAQTIGSKNKPKLVIDFGTATNLNYINENNEFLGGAICPGIATMKFSLLAKTSQLIDVEFDNNINPLGKSTSECIQSGIIYSQKGLIQEFIKSLQTNLSDLEIFITGGFSNVMKDYLEFDLIHETKLSLIGIKKLYELNN